MANFAKKLTPKELEEVETMAGLGMRFEDIARLKGMCLDTLRKYAREQLGRGKARAKAAVMQTAYKMAVSGKFPAMTMFWLKTQAAWRENMPEENPPAGKPAEGLDKFLQQAIEQVQNGRLDPKAASVIASLSNALIKATEQASLEERLACLESVLKQQPQQEQSSLLDQAGESPSTLAFIAEEDS